MNRGILPCTAFTFVRDGAATLEETLRSCLFCEEHLLLDGGSTDGTAEMAAGYGCHVVPQSKQYLNTEGKIVDFAGIWNQGIRLAKHPWIVCLSSDEYFSDVLMQEIQARVQRNVPGVFFADRWYTLDGNAIQYASTYPNRQIRLFHRDAIEGFVKKVHERPALKPGIEPAVLRGNSFAPLEAIDDLRRKSRHYLLLEEHALGTLSWSEWFRFAWGKFLRMALRAWRILKIRLTRRSAYLPLPYERLHLWYPWRLMIDTCPLFRSRT
jgi:glycosyltransferase involved in cell wall biosynthesis